MSYSAYFGTGVTQSGAKFVARYDGEYLGTFDTWREANDACKARARR
jgi:hypothetical protein